MLQYCTYCRPGAEDCTCFFTVHIIDQEWCTGEDGTCLDCSRLLQYFKIQVHGMVHDLFLKGHFKKPLKSIVCNLGGKSMSILFIF